ncbi:MAG: RluA family pseudouridine synthase [Lactobacillales bacterium]|jgi:23S rRNA pseudouridine1911/1915/1917 synthase|nr:RluA family pseudouridine synthase [Lactobacillales bacterium]
MQYTIPLPENFQKKTIRELLENDWLVPRKVRHFLRTRKNVAVNGEVKMFHEEVQAGDKVTLTFEEADYPSPSILFGDKRKVEILYEDEHLLIANKPVGMKTHPNQPDETDTLLNHLADYLKDKGEIPYVVHRLDKETSGAVLFSKNPVILPILGRMLEKKEIHRKYQAVVQGKLSKNHLTINKKIGRDRHDRRKRIIDERKGATAITHVTVNQYDPTQNRSMLTLVLDTGRTHQIRVHLLSIGHPIIGDPLYSKKSAPRLMLHAETLYFTHPFTLEKIEAVALPKLF